ncbi:hypothetical protein LINPERHAP2_LOCUS19236, partial [Linum perenne]
PPPPFSSSSVTATRPPWFRSEVAAKHAATAVICFRSNSAVAVEVEGSSAGAPLLQLPSKKSTIAAGRRRSPPSSLSLVPERQKGLIDD